MVRSSGANIGAVSVCWIVMMTMMMIMQAAAQAPVPSMDCQEMALTTRNHCMGYLTGKEKSVTADCCSEFSFVLMANDRAVDGQCRNCFYSNIIASNSTLLQELASACKIVPSAVNLMIMSICAAIAEMAGNIAPSPVSNSFPSTGVSPVVTIPVEPPTNSHFSAASSPAPRPPRVVTIPVEPPINSHFSPASSPAPRPPALHKSSSTPNQAPLPVQGASLSQHKSSRSIGGGLIGAVVGAIMITVVAVICVLLWRRRKTTITESFYDDQSRKGFSNSVNTEFVPPSHGPCSFSYEQLSIATSDFSESELLGRGGFGLVYKGKLHNAEGTSFVAVKCISKSSSQGDKEFKAEVTIISDLRHRNLVKLKGWCNEHGKLLLVYEYMPNGSLDYLLFDDGLSQRLTWERRYTIALGLGSALHYLHDQCDNVIIHRDIKSSNVLLDQCFTAKLGDFGLSRQMNLGITSHMTIMAGTRGYMAPECLVGFGKATRETDVYAFGIVLLELVSGKRAVDVTLQEHEGMLVDWVGQMRSQGRLEEVVDKRLRGMYDKEESKRVVMVGLACAAADAKARPKIRSALEALRGSVGLPPVPDQHTLLSSPRPSSTTTTCTFSATSSSSCSSCTVAPFKN